jgi:hypothetical protein
MPVILLCWFINIVLFGISCARGETGIAVKPLKNGTLPVWPGLLMHTCSIPQLRSPRLAGQACNVISPVALYEKQFSSVGLKDCMCYAV